MLRCDFYRGWYIRHRMSPWWMLYSLTVTFIFKVKHFIFMHLLWKIAQAGDVPSRFAPTCTVLGWELLLTTTTIWIYFTETGFAQTTVQTAHNQVFCVLTHHSYPHYSTIQIKQFRNTERLKHFLHHKE